MPKKILVLSLALCGMVFLSGCGNKADQTSQGETAAKNSASENPAGNSQVIDETPSDTSATGNNSVQVGESASLNICQKENVSLPNYGDPGKRLPNCFVEYPGEPSRQDKSYYIVEDICGQFTKEFMENMLEQKIAKIEPPQIDSLNNCTYYLKGSENILLNLEYLPIENQKTGSEAMGRKTEKSDQIPLDNLVVWQDDSLINTIYLVLGPNKFLSLRPSSKNTIDKDNFIKLAANIASAIKSYK
jgi:hypothetical protein